MSWETIFEYEEPGLCYEHNEFVVQQDTETGQYRYGSDGGCSCYGGFDEENFVTSHDRYDVRKAFAGWVFDWYSGQGAEGDAWTEFNQKVPR